MKINLVCNIFGTDGYSNVGRNLANALHERGCEVRIDCTKPDGWQRNVSDAELLMLKRDFDEEYTTIMMGLPPYWRFALGDNPKKFIGYLVFEGDSIPSYWIHHLSNENVSQIWTPSEHTKEAIVNTIDRLIKEKKK